MTSIKRRYLQDFVKENFAKGKLNEMVFEKIRKPIQQKSLTIFQNIAHQCLHDEREERPTTKKVLAKLENALEIQNMASTMTKFTLLQITLKEVVEATNNFHVDNITGHGKFGTTYKGRLLMFGKEIKIVARRFDCKHGEVDLMFLREISVLYDQKPKNIVSIVGFCDEQDEKIIITMYEANRSLGQYLNNLNLTWMQRLRICVGIARALSYLHDDKVRDYAIIHCNINSNTILLDENWEAKLSSFEVSIKQPMYNKDRVRHCEHIGSMGCMDPAIEKTGGVTHKSDIYSLGIVLFEMLCGRKAFIPDEANSFLAPLAKYHYEKETLQEIIHSCLQWNQMSAQSLLKYSNIAYSCLKEDRADRPDIDFIVREFEKALEF
ncbi:receptor-like protein kinase ANXUR2 [Bidens hawaiensis]|uniref:receptor-like protein kinase ANXUR2 n=1 Tax=Bidens hawaiensis TaxID=980011 RepID=UPI004049D73D